MATKVLVTGAMGYVGTRLVPFLLDKGYQVRGLDLCLYSDIGLKTFGKNPGFELMKSDLRDPDAIRKAVSGVDSVIHLGAISNDPTGNIDETLTRQVNFDAVGMLVSMAQSAGVKRFISASSSSVFGIKDDANVIESLEPEPITFYSKYKMLSEWIVKAASNPKFCTVSIRPATICGYSPRQRFDLTVNKLTADAYKKGEITVHGGEQRRPNVGMADMIQLYAHLLEIPAEKINGKTFNFGFENHKVIDLAKIVQSELQKLGKKVKITVADVIDKRDYHISSDKILRELNYKPVSSIAQEVKGLCDKLETEFKDIDADEYYNMKSMKLSRKPSAYQFLAL